MTAAQKNDWLSRVERAAKRADSEWRNEGRTALKIYHGSKGRALDAPLREPFNILYSNTETLAPALFNSSPRPDVSPRRTKAQPLTKLGARALHQYIDFIIDCNDARYETLPDAVSAAVVSALVPGLGQVRVREPLEEGGHLSIESVPFDRFLWGWARRWQDVPWVAFGHDLTYLDFKKRYPKYSKDLPDEDSIGNDYLPQSGTEGEESDAYTNRLPGVLVWEVWDKGSRKIYEVSDAVPGAILNEKPWSLNFSSSFPCPKPLWFVDKVATLAPSTLYSYYENQAVELNRITRRLNRVIDAIKVRGVYNAAIGEIERVLDEDDNALIPARNAALAMDSGGLDRHIWFMPVDQLVKTAKELYAARESVKAVIYEIMGIADLLRGQGQAAETATASGIKDKWGTLRLKKSQRRVQFFIRDIFRLIAEAAPQVVRPEAWALATDLDLPMRAEQMQVKTQIASALAVGQEPPPELMARAETPALEDVLEFLGSSAQRTYLIDVESNSTVDIEATEDKEAIAEFMNAMGQFLAGVTPLVQEGILPFEAAKGMLLEIMRRFRFSKQVEEYLMQMQAPQPKGDEEAQKQKAEAEQAVEQLKDFESKIKGAMRGLQEQKAAFDTEKKVFQIEQAAQEKVAQANAQVRDIKFNAQATVASTKFKATADKIQTGLAARAKEVAPANPDEPEAPDQVALALQGIAQAQSQMAQALAALGQAITTLRPSDDDGEREIAMMGADGKVRTAMVRRARKPEALN